MIINRRKVFCLCKMAESGSNYLNNRESPLLQVLLEDLENSSGSFNNHCYDSINIGYLSSKFCDLI